MEKAATQKAEQTLAQAVEGKLEEMTRGEGVPSNVEVAQQLEALKPGPDVSREYLSETGRELTAELDKLVDDTQRLFLEKNRDEDLQKAAIHASRAAQIARRHDLLTTEEGRRAMEEAKEGVYGATNFARLLITSPEFRDELVEAIGVIQQSLRRGGPTAKGGKAGGIEAELTEESDKEEEDEGEEEEQGRWWQSQGHGQGQAETGATGTTSSTTVATTGTATTTKKSYEPMSQNQIEHVAQRFVRLLKRLQSKPEYQQNIRFLIERLRAAFQMGGLHAERMERQLAESQAGRAFMEETQLAKDHALRLIENWTESSLDPLFTQLNALNDQMQNDTATRQELGALGSFVEGQLSGQAFKGSEEAVVQEAKERFGRVRERLLTRYDDRIRRVVDELAYLRDSFRDNEAATVLQKDINELVRTLVYDEQGQPKVKLELLKDLEVLFSAFLRKVQFIPVPRIAAVTPDFDFAVDNVTIVLREIMPKQIHIETLTRVHDPELEKAGHSVREAEEQRHKEVRGAGAGAGATTTTTVTPQGTVATTTTTTTTHGQEPLSLETFVRIHLTGIHSDLRNVAWYYAKKRGVIQEHDRGLADIRIGGKGMSIDLDVEPGLPVPTAEKPVAHTLDVKRAKCKIHKLDLRLYESKHDTIYMLLKPFIKSQVRQAIERAVEQYLVEYCQELDKYATTSATGQYPVTRPIKVGPVTTATGQQQQAPQPGVVGVGAGAGAGAGPGATPTTTPDVTPQSSLTGEGAGAGPKLAGAAPELPTMPERPA